MSGHRERETAPPPADALQLGPAGGRGAVGGRGGAGRSCSHMITRHPPRAVFPSPAPQRDGARQFPRRARHGTKDGQQKVAKLFKPSVRPHRSKTSPRGVNTYQFTQVVCGKLAGGDVTEATADMAQQAQQQRRRGGLTCLMRLFSACGVTNLVGCGCSHALEMKNLWLTTRTERQRHVTMTAMPGRAEAPGSQSKVIREFKPRGFH